MKTIILFAIFMATVTFISCSESNNDVLSSNESVLDVQTDGVLPTRATISAFPNQAEIGLFVTSGSLGSYYNNLSANANVKAVYNSSSNTWIKTPEVYLSPASATIFAYYPYSTLNNDGTLIPVEHTSQTDYLAGTHTTGQAVINNGNPVVNLTMKHALSLLQFRFCKQNYPGAGILTKIEISNKTGKTVLFSSGTLNIATGNITNTTGKNLPAVLSCSYTLPASFSTNLSDYSRIIVLPVTTTNLGDVQMKFTVDGKIYTYDVPAMTEWEAGKSNTYSVTLSGMGLTMNTVVVEDWIRGESSNVEIN